MKFQDIYRYFQEPPPIYLSKEVAVCYILSTLLVQGASYGTALIQRVELDYPLYRLSDTVLYSALKFLEDEEVIEGYWQKVEGRGRPRRMYQVTEEKLEQAKNLSHLWERYLGEQSPSSDAGNIQSG
ncbi:PadR family transcriptional regulator [Synechococcales cyanobacterium C]|uniref:PadR family transcriptional regulator n=1 Tax=Petrachloros mirabilis ULC683 TaxID=2781853 RepID=A0A8K2A0F1_9CYAN|nr:PadR family transcriptional regulator [Petrachloros mirabilis]NCJ08519.1 PadR family transcriptional regulator [Petrachloros mirabilis ULC683]